ncbi:hypothetical protein ACIOHS_48675 [Streptomyces sp. NPDC088253]
MASASADDPGPDFPSFLNALRDDPIAFVNWKLELPIPDPYKPIAKPLVK